MKIIASISFLFFSCNLVFAQCGTTSCVAHNFLSNKDYKKVLDKIDVIFYGAIISQSEVIHPEKDFPYRILKVKVLRAWKGVDTNEVEIKYGYYDNDCAMLGESGKRIFYASLSNQTPSFQTGQCTKEGYNDKQTKQVLGEGKVIEDTKPTLEQSPTPSDNSKSFWSNIWKKIVSFFS